MGHKSRCQAPNYFAKISLTECNSGTIQTLPIGVTTTIELKNIETTSHNNGIQRDMFQLRRVPGLSHVVVTFFNSIEVLLQNGNFLIVPLLNSVGDTHYPSVSLPNFQTIGVHTTAHAPAVDYPHSSCGLQRTWNSHMHITAIVLSSL